MRDQRPDARAGRGALRQGRRLRQLRLQQEPRRGLRADGLRVGLPQALLPGPVRDRAHQRPAHGLLPGRGAHQRRQAPRRGGAAGGRQRQPLPHHHRVGRPARHAAARRGRHRAAAGGRGLAGRRGARRGGPRPLRGARPRAGYGIRLGLHLVKGIGEAEGEALDAERARGGPFRSLADLVARTELPEEVVERLIRAGALDSLGQPRREALWQLREVAGAARGRSDGRVGRLAQGPGTAAGPPPATHPGAGAAAADGAGAPGRRLRHPLARRPPPGHGAVPAGARPRSGR